ncbi:EAL domain-containing protein [Massilia pinisoli]|uniref:EAL domain-containing protein n=1 Tax=Massilia pinisoli TaxID=1772194 RepID=A0ABT1ZJW2_9BURK|nr:EAL domain-containing protein [Massilia pinisoli]MCS0580198.1 EAL domain-containing protein [Massilia pinisoli]
MTTTHATEKSARPYDILVAEDSPTQARHLAQLLEQDQDCHVRVAADGTAALQAAREHVPDLVISDVAMPGMDGYALCRALKDDPRLATVPILLFTRLTSLQDLVRSLEAGADGFVRKPYDDAQMRARVRRILHGRDAGSPAGPLDAMAEERRHIHELLVATHDEALRLNAELAAQRAELARTVDSLAVVGKIAAALNEAAGEADVAQAALDHLLRVPSVAGAAIGALDTDGSTRPLAQGGDVPGPSECGCAPDNAPGATVVVCVPLHAGGRPLGLLHVRAVPAGFAAEDRQLLDSVAQQLALALDRARLYARAEALVVERTAALRSERNRLSAIVESAGTLVLQTDPDGRVVTFNRACEEALGWRARQALGRFYWDVVRGVDDPDAMRRVLAGLADGEPPQRLQGEWRTPDGRTRSIAWTHTPLRHEDGSVESVLATGVDVTELRGAEQRLHYASNYDSVTGLPNRDLLRERLRRMKAEARDGGRILGFMLVRFGRMALIREALGPVAEQALLQEAGTRLRETAAPDVVARFSEGAFAMLLLRADAEELAVSARRVLAALGAAYAYDREEFHLDPAIGIAVYPNDGVAYETLARGAETALRQAADSGSQRYAFYRPELNRGANDRFKLENALHRALERGELELHYQPQVAVGGGIASAEALLRWRHPERGFVPPVEFVPLAEESDLILEIGEWVLEQVCSQLRAWRRAGVPVVPIAVNLSAHQFDDSILGTVRRVLDDCGLAPELLELELTESASMADAGKSCALLDQLKGLGVRLAIDDFGTGYSNLNYLKRFPVDRLKLDRSFVHELETDADDLAIARAVIAMAHGLRLSVVAEGVETPGQLELLAGLGCDHVQGWLFSRAVPAPQLAKLLARGPGQVPM